MLKKYGISLLVIVLLTGILVLPGCADEPATATTATVTSGGGGGTGGGIGGGDGVASTATQTDEYRIAVYQNEVKVGSLNLEKLQSLPLVTFNKSTGEVEEGPTLLSALALLGIVDFTSVTVEGFVKGRVATAELTLQRGEVDETVILEFNNQGKTKLAGKEIPEDNWIIDINTLRVK